MRWNIQIFVLVLPLLFCISLTFASENIDANRSSISDHVESKEASKKERKFDIANFIRIIFYAQVGVCSLGLLLNAVLIFLLVKMISVRYYSHTFHPSHFIILAVSDIILLAGKLMEMKGVWKLIPFLEDAWLHLIVPSTIAVYTTIFLFGIKHHVKRVCDKNEERIFLAIANHCWILMYVFTGVLLPTAIFIFQHYYGENKNEDELSQELVFTRRSLALLSFVSLIVALLSFIINFVSVITGFRGDDQLSASRALSQVILPISLFFIITNLPWLLYHEEDVIDLCRMKELEYFDDDYYDDYTYTINCSNKLDSFVDWGLVLNSSFNLLFFCCFGGVYFRQYLCGLCPCCFCFDCCGCSGCRSRISKSVLSLGKEDKHHYVAASQQLNASSAISYSRP